MVHLLTMHLTFMTVTIISFPMSTVLQHQNTPYFKPVMHV